MAAIKLTRPHRILVGVILAGALLIAAIGFVGSYTAVRELAEEKGFGAFSPFFPIGVDAGIVVLLALDLLLTWLRIPFPLLRQTAWLLTAATIAFNAASAWGDPLAVGMHGIIPVLFIITIEAARHAIGRVADITADKHMEGVRMWRWLLSPVPTFRLWRRMKLWELRSYEQVIAMERDRLVYQARLRADYGRAWRRRAPVEALMPLKLARYGVPLEQSTAARPGGRGGEVTARPTPALAGGARDADGREPAPAASGAGGMTALGPADATGAVNGALPGPAGLAGQNGRPVNAVAGYGGWATQAGQNGHPTHPAAANGARAGAVDPDAGPGAPAPGDAGPTPVVANTASFEAPLPGNAPTAEGGWPPATVGPTAPATAEGPGGTPAGNPATANGGWAGQAGAAAYDGQPAGGQPADAFVEEEPWWAANQPAEFDDAQQPQLTVPVGPGRSRPLGGNSAPDGSEGSDGSEEPDDPARSEIFYAAYRQYVKEQGDFPNARQLSRYLHEEHGITDADGTLLSEQYLREFTRTRGFKERCKAEIGTGG
ncbi:DUF2637 domain-containing protein [Streptomyces hainanensis]|uniref:DUF2637 domain-containing protein n=1 Tax=Streptomyces hainanensis TaxID=402648 RepID=A0A4R4TH51_9ACTN|nr:DUF2637 domain-containing protein [Streptomyces hainanensis]TDC76897.1 DUF2637 domain-containing protein [Streptomyces hainanensis]